MTPELTERIQRGKEWLAKTHVESPAELKGRMDAIAKEFLAELDGLSSAQQGFSPGAGQWCVKEVCLHMANAARAVGQLVGMLASGQTIPKAAVRMSVLDDDPGNFNTVVDSLRKAFQSAGDAAKSLEGSPNLANRVEHPFFGPLNCREWMAFNPMHTTVHVRQLKRIKGSSGFPGSDGASPSHS